MRRNGVRVLVRQGHPLAVNYNVTEYKVIMEIGSSDVDKQPALCYHPSYHFYAEDCPLRVPR